MSNCKRWTCEEDARLMYAHRTGLHLGLIALELHRSEGAIKSRLAKHFFHVEHGKRCSSVNQELEGAIAHLTWLRNRLVNVHLENPNVDYIKRFDHIIETFKSEDK